MNTVVKRHAPKALDADIVSELYQRYYRPDAQNSISIWRLRLAQEQARQILMSDRESSAILINYKSHMQEQL
jgi:hypothetical protein